ncbi:MAG: hypothetical protein COB41_00325 [Proteobacteria bacterium]|nr:MAG: hypothetical protein COB41_00325 [Pseudomonadota bacterium]
MADISDIEAAQAIKLIGSSSDGTEQNPVGSIDTSLKMRPSGRDPQGLENLAKSSGKAYEYSTERLTTPDAPLTSVEVLETPWINSMGWSSIEIYIHSNVPSIIGGIEIQRTLDPLATTPLIAGQSEDHSYTVQDVSNGFKVIRVPPSLLGFRVVFTNSITAQSSFELIIIQHKDIVQNPSIQLTDTLVITDSATVTKSVLSAHNDLEQYLDIGRDGEGHASLNTHINGISPALGQAPYDSIETGQINVVDGEAFQIPPSTLTYPGNLKITNLDSVDMVFYGKDSSVTALTGDVIFPEQSKNLNINSNPEVWAITETGVAEINTIDINATTVDSNNGVIDPSNMLISDDTRSIFDNISDSCEIGSFDGSGSITLSNITSVKIKAEMRKESGAASEIINYSDAYSLAIGNPTTITSPVITAGVNLSFIVYVSRRDIFADVINVTNTMGLSGFTIIDDVQNEDESRITAIIMTGTASSNGTISVTFDTGADYGCIGVLSFSNVSSASPIFDSDTDFGNNDDTLAGSVSTLTNGMVIMGVGAEFATVTTREVGFINRIDNIGSTGNNAQILDISTFPVPTTGTKNWSTNFSSATADTSGITLSLNPSDALDPITIVQYEISNVLGATSMSQQVSPESDTEYEVDITADRAWTETDIDNLSLVPSISLIGNAALEIDKLWIEVVESGSQARISYVYEGND